MFDKDAEEWIIEKRVRSPGSRDEIQGHMGIVYISRLRIGRKLVGLEYVCVHVCARVCVYGGHDLVDGDLEC